MPAAAAGSGDRVAHAQGRGSTACEGAEQRGRGQEGNIHHARLQCPCLVLRVRWPQEGELRPQLLDRFGMSVNVSTLMDTKQRTQMVLDR